MIIIDTETTGLDPQKHSIVSIGALEFSNPQNQFYDECRPWSGAEILEKSLEINGFSKEELLKKEKSLEQLIKEFLIWAKPIKGKILAGENVWLDIGFLQESFKKAKEDWIFGYRLIDLHTLSYFFHVLEDKNTLKKETQFSLDHTLKYVGLPEEPKPHNALTGAKCAAEAFSRLIYKKNLLEEFKKHPT
jgi:DNA polymerase-3 subunit epsilon